VPAPHASPISSIVSAPSAMAASTSLVVAAWQRQMYIGDEVENTFQPRRRQLENRFRLVIAENWNDLVAIRTSPSAA
jgi:hypothetical protein